MTGLRIVLLAILLGIMPAAAEAAEVNIIRPPEQRLDENRTRDVKPQVTAITAATIVIIAAPVESRPRRVDRQLFQRWTGFSRQYQGRRYPF